MQDHQKTKADLLQELAELRQEVARLKTVEAECLELKQQTPSAQSITERRQAGEALRESEEKYRAILENVADGYYEVDLAGNFTFFTDSLCEILGYPKDELMGMNNRHYADTENSQKVYRAFNKVYETEKPVKRFAWEGTKKDGTKVYVETSASLVRDATGQPIGFRGVARDITERKQTEEKLRDKEERYRLLLDSSPDPVVTYDDTGQAIYFNPAFVKTFGWPLDELLGKRIDFVPEENLAETQDAIKRVIGGESVIFETNRLTKDGQALDILISASPHKDKAGDFAGMVVILRNITERKQAENALRKQAAELATVAQVSTAAATILEPDRLLQEVVDLTKSSFNLYHTHIYLLNNTEDILVLTAGAGKVGRQMVTEGWSIPFEQKQSLVARVARTRQGIVANNVREIPDWLPNPLLPNTRSELALPMIVGNTLLGVLDVQADVVDRFTDEDVRTKTTLAAQVAVALQNARSFERSEQAIKELNTLTRRLTREGWDSYLDTLTASEAGYMYDLKQLAPIRHDDPHPVEVTEPTLTQPLIVQGETIGYLALNEPQALTNTAAEIVNTVAERLSTHLENLRLSEQTERALTETEAQARRLALLNEMGAALSQAINTDEVYKIVATTTPQIVGTERASVALVTPEGDKFEVLALSGPRGAIPTGTQLPLAGTAVGRTIRENQITIVPDTGISEYMDSRQLSKRGLLSTMMAPLISGGQVIGSLNVGNAKLDAYGPGDERLLAQVASLLASTLQNRRLFEQTEQALAQTEDQARRLTQLNEMSQQLNQVTSEDEVFKVAARQVTRIIHADRASVTLLTPTRDYFDVFSLRGETADVIPVGDQLPVEGSAVGKAVQENRVIITPDTAVSEFPEHSRLLERGLRSIMNVPLMRGGQMIGTLNVASKEVNVYTSRDENLILQIASLLGSTIESRRLFEQTQTALAEVRRLAAIVENHPDFVGVGSLDDKALYVNPAGLRMMGLPPDHDVTTMDARGFFSPAEANLLLKEGIPTALEKGSWSAEANLLKADGTTIPVEETVGINYDTDGRPYSFSITMRDITERKQAAEALGMSEAKYRALFTQISDPILIFDEETNRFLDCNQSALARYGYSLEELQAMTPHQLHPPDEIERVERNIDDGEETSAHYYTHITKSGERLQVEVYTTPLEYGGRKAWISTIRDITERKQAEEALRVSEERFALAMQGTNDGIWDWDIVNGTLYWSPRMKELYGYSPEELDDDFDKFESRLHPDDEEHVNTAMEAHLKERVPYDVEQRMRTKSGEYRWFRARGQAIWDENGNPLRMSGSSTDITERKAAEAERERLLAEVEATYRQYVRREWEQFLGERHQGHWHIEHQRAGLAGEQGDNGAEEQSKIQNPKSKIEAPISLRGQAIGSLSLQDIDPDRKWTDEERALVEAVSEQLALTVENLRLFDDTRQRATREQLTRQIADKMRTLPDVNSIIQVGVQELAKVLGGSHTAVELNVETDDQ